MRSSSWGTLLGVIVGLGLVVRDSGSHPGPCSHAQRSLDALQLVRATGQFVLDGQPFSGTARRWHANGRLAETVGFCQGRRNGVWATFYPDGTPRSRVEVRRGRRHGVARSFWPSGRLRSEGHLVDGVPHGVQRQWYRSGARFKELRLVHGRERGLQRAWRENGALYNNYEARDGRIYGLKRAKLCFQLDGEEVIDGARVDVVDPALRMPRPDGADDVASVL